MTQDCIDINKWLQKTYGKNVIGKPKFRLVWSEEITENRKGEWNEFCGNLFLRTVKGVRLVKKYNYITERYILEGWYDADLSTNGEIPDAKNGDYVPVYVFEDSKGNPLPVTYKALEFIIASVQGRVRKDEEISEEKTNEQEIAKTVESFDDHPGYFKTSGETRNAVAYDKGLQETQDFKETVN